MTDQTVSYAILNIALQPYTFMNRYLFGANYNNRSVTSILIGVSIVLLRQTDS